VAVASAGPYASLHLTPDRKPRQHPTTQFFTGRMPFLLPNQQRQSTEGTTNSLIILKHFYIALSNSTKKINSQQTHINFDFQSEETSKMQQTLQTSKNTLP